MTSTTLPATRSLFIPAALALSGVLALAAHISIPFWPVPATMQVLAVLAIAGLAGRRLGVAAFAAYLVEGACGLPVFARGGGLAYFAGPTTGYLLGQFAAMALVALLVARGRVMLGMLAGVAVIYACGVPWLSAFVGWDQAVALGLTPFLLADLTKAGIAAALTLLARRAR